MTGVLISVFQVPARAAGNPGVKIGVLTCNKIPGTEINLLIHSTAQIECVFTSGNGVEKYKGETGVALGLDLEWDTAKTIVFTIFTATSDKSPGAYALAGKYVGGTASVTVGVGLGAKVLVGGSDNQFSLYPLVIEDKAGLGATLGIGYLYLEPFKEKS